MHRILLAGLALGLSTAAHGQQLDITLRSDAPISEADLENELNSAIGSLLKADAQDQLSTSMAEAAAISLKGMGVDYASNIKKFEVGGSVGSGAHEAGFSFKKGGDVLPKGGFAAQLTLMAGINLGIGDNEKEHGIFDGVKLYVNGMSMKLPSGREFGGSMNNIGGHLQVKVIPGINAKVTEWGGIDLTSGYERTEYTLALRQPIPVTAPIDDGSLSWDASGAYDIRTLSQSVPVELSTNLRVLVATVYVGGAFDYNLADSASQASLSGPLSATINGTINNQRIGTASLDFAGEGAALQQGGRFFGGLQANILLLKVYGHVNVGLNGGVAGHLGARIAL